MKLAVENEEKTLDIDRNTEKILAHSITIN